MTEVYDNPFKLFIFNIRMRLIEWLSKPEYMYLDHIIDMSASLVTRRKWKT